MKKQFLKTMFLLAAFMMLSQFANAAVIFEDNFNAATWSSRIQGILPDDNPASVSCSPSYCPAGSVPTGWDYSYLTGRWWGPNKGKPSGLIDSMIHYGQSGNSYITYSEPLLSTSGGWGSDSIIMKMLPKEYNELFIRVKVKFDPAWIWSKETSPMKKFMRFGHYLGVGDPWDGNGSGLTKGKTKPQIILDLAKWNTGNSDIAFDSTIRCYPYYSCVDDAALSKYFRPNCYNGKNNSNTTCYFPPYGSYGGSSANPHTDFTDPVWNPGTRLFNDSPGMIGDGGWHVWEAYFKNNSAPGATDGVLKFWLDGVLIQSFDALPYNDSNADSLKGINVISLGGNIFNEHAFDTSTYPEQWVAYDDLVVYTPITATDPLWATSSKDGRLPYNYLITPVTPPAKPAGLTVQ